MEFENIGFMIDLSRGKVLKVESLKKIIRNAKEFGYTYINLYLEDLLTLEDYPQFGYMRGKYSDEEILELVDYCKQIEIDLFPAIQTLGHLEHFLRWDCSENLKDTEQVLNVKNKETEKFLIALISKCRKLFNSSKINIGMDEAFDLGQGKLLREGNLESQKELYTKHLDLVVKICKDEGYETIKIWSDMLFNIYSNAGGDGLYSMDENAQIDQINDNVEIIFWNYWTKEAEEYERVIEIHEMFSDNVSIALGVHTWGLPFYNVNQLPITKAALEASHNKQLKDVLFTMWGDDGSLYNLDSAIFGLYVTSCEVFGKEYDPDYFNQQTNLDFDVLNNVSRITDCGINPLRIIWNDPISNLQLKLLDNDMLNSIATKAENLKISTNDKTSNLFNTYLACIINDINLYQMSQIDEKFISQCKEDLKSLFEQLEYLWQKEAKLNGIEEMQMRFTSKINRYQFLFDNQTDSELKSMRSERVERVKELPENFNGIAKATKYRW